MRALQLTILTLFLGLQISAALPIEGEFLYLNDRMEVVKNKNKASYTCKLEGHDENGYLFKVYFITGEVKMEGYYKDEDMSQAHGLFTYYYRNGKVESSGHFRNGNKYGIWQRYNADGTPKAEKIYAIQPILQAMQDEPGK